MAAKKMEKWELDNLKRLQAAISAVELTEAEEKTLAWLAGWEDNTINNLCSIFKKLQR